MEGAVVALSGGQDSTTCLYWAIEKWGASGIIAVTFFYNQRHDKEVVAAYQIAKSAGVHNIQMDAAGYGYAVKCALTDRSKPIEVLDGELPTTFVPARNLVFATILSGIANIRGLHHVVLGVCETDYSGYPDCRDETIRSMERTCRLGLSDPLFTIHTPLMFLSKAETVKLARTYSGCWEALGQTVTCYNGERPGCGECPSCKLRAKGFAEAGYPDPAGA